MTSPCDEHSGHCARLDALESTVEKTQASIDDLKKSMNRWSGAIIAAAAIPLIIKIVELLASAAHAIGGVP